LRKLFVLFLALILCSVFSHASEIGVEINSVPVEFNENSGRPFIDENNRVLVPLRIILESIGADVGWNSEENAAEARKGNIKVMIPIERSYIVRNGESIDVDARAKIVNGRTYLPIRSVMESFGYEIGWNNETQNVLLNEKAEAHKVSIEKEEVSTEEVMNNKEVIAKIEGNTNGNLLNDGFIVKEDDVLYYVNYNDGQKIYSYNINTKTHKMLTEKAGKYLNVINGRIVYLENNGSGDWNAFCMNVDGTEKKQLGQTGVNYIKAFDKGVYFYDERSTTLLFWSYNDEEPKKLLTTNLDSIQIVDNYLYYIELESYGWDLKDEEIEYRISRINLETMKSEYLYPANIGSEYNGFVVNEKYLFYSRNDLNSKLYQSDNSINKNGVGKNAQFPSDDKIYNFCIDDKFIYYFNPYANKGVMKIDIETGEKKRIVKTWKSYDYATTRINSVDEIIYLVRENSSTEFDFYRIDQEKREVVKIKEPSDLIE